MMSTQTLHHPATQATPDDAILRIEHLTKVYGAFSALSDVTLDVQRGSIHGLLGENGAGKSTLVGLIAGMRSPTGGRIVFDGHEMQGADVKAMEQAGVFLVTQEPMIVGQLSVAENLLLGHWPARRGFINWKRLQAQARLMLEGVQIDPNALADDLRAVDRRKLNILRALFSGGRLIILDEPTTALTMRDRAVLFDFMRELKSQGITFIFISHYNEEILDICDAVTVLRDGKLAGGSDTLADMSSAHLSELVLGRGLELFRRDRTRPEGEQAGNSLQVDGVVAPNVRVQSFAIARGEVVGFAGLLGSGAKEFAQTLFGLNPATAGRLHADETHVACSLPTTPSRALARGIAYLSDDRRRDGVVGLLSIGNNISLSSLPALSLFGFVRRQAETSMIGRYFRELGVKAPSPDVAVDTLSGGNQQKVCLGRLLATQPQLLILDEPTRGIDVGVKEDVHRMVDALTAQGLSVIVVTTDLDEMSRITDRVCIFLDGEIVETLYGDDITPERLRQAAFSSPITEEVAA
ncbi:sugar ABC transporter ATP-binding protein [Lichenicola cladoniae]|nr:sugar ABC transporter ATP-binding protein [Lichenicola cladoniae]